MRYAIVALATVLAGPAAAQVMVSPQVTTPASWERYAIRVINQTDTATVSVRVEVPEIIFLLGVEPKAGWTVQVIPATDSTRQAVSWTGGSVTRGQFSEFAILGRLDPNAKREPLGFPVRIQRANGSVVEWRGRFGEPYAAPRVEIKGSVAISQSGAIAMAASGIALGILAIIIAVALGTRAPADKRTGG